MNLVYNLVDFFLMNNNEKEIFSYIKKEYPIKSVSIMCNLKSSDLLFINQNYKSE